MIAVTHSKLFGTLMLGVGLLSSNLAKATTYTVDEIFSGSWTAVWGLPIATFTHNATLQSLVSGDSSLFSDSISTAEVINNVTTCVSCSSIELLKDGNKIFASTSVAFGGGFVPNATTPGLLDNLYIGTITITGGTGIFQGATGSGTYKATDFGVMNVDSNGNLISFNPNGKWAFEQTYTIDTAIASTPLPEAYILMLTGLGLIGFIALRRNYNLI